MKMMALAPAQTPEHPPSAATPSTINIDKGVPMPRADRRGGRIKSIERETMEALAVGESFVYPTVRKDLRATQIYAGRTGAYLKPKKFARRMVTENGERVVRVWRVA